MNAYQVSDEVWGQIQPLIPVAERNPQKPGRPRVDDRKVFNGVLFVLRTGCQWNALNATGICSSSTAHLRFQTWVKAGVFFEIWKRSLLKYNELKGIDWRWTSLDGAIAKAPLGGKKNRTESNRSRKNRNQTKPSHRR